MAPGSRAWRSLCGNPPVNPTGKQDELAGQGPVRRFNARSNEAPTKAPTPPKAPIPPLVLLSTEDFFTKFMKVFMKITQVQAQALAEPQEQLLKARSLEIYSRKSHMDSYYFCQQYENHFETSSATGMNRTPFVVLFLRSIISLKWAQHKRRHQSATPITWSEFKIFLRKDLGNS